MTLLATAPAARADEPPAWVRARDPQWSTAQDLRSVGLLMTGAGTALMIGFGGVLVARLVDLLPTRTCDRRPDGSSTCDFWQPSDRPAEIGLVSAGAAALGIGLPLVFVGDQRALLTTRAA